MLIPLLVVLAAVGLAPLPAHAGSAGLEPVLDCVNVNSDGTYQAVFAYTNTGRRTYSYGFGKFNTMSPSSLNGIQPTSFPPGTDTGQFSTPAQDPAQSVSWTLNSITVTAQSTSPACGPDVVLPTEGNGMGAVIVLGGSVLVSVVAMRLRRRRARRAGQGDV